MNGKKVYPLNFFNTVFFGLFCAHIAVSMLVFTQKTDLVLSYFTYGIVFIAVIGIPTFLLHKITIGKVDLFISDFNTKGYRIYRLPYGRIKGLEIHKIRASLLGIRYMRYYFVVYFNDIYMVINNERYFSGQLISLFEYLNEKYNISYNVVDKTLG